MYSQLLLAWSGLVSPSPLPVCVWYITAGVRSIIVKVFEHAMSLGHCFIFCLKSRVTNQGRFLFTMTFGDYFAALSNKWFIFVLTARELGKDNGRLNVSGRKVSKVTGLLISPGGRLGDSVTRANPRLFIALPMWHADDTTRCIEGMLCIILELFSTSPIHAIRVCLHNDRTVISDSTPFFFLLLYHYCFLCFNHEQS